MAISTAAMPIGWIQVSEVPAGRSMAATMPSPSANQPPAIASSARAEQQETGPGEARQHRNAGQPPPAAPPGDGEHRNVEQGEISQQGQRAGVGIADQPRREEAADQARAPRCRRRAAATGRSASAVIASISTEAVLMPMKP
jgi:hypothetical protein